MLNLNLLFGFVERSEDLDLLMADGCIVLRNIKSHFFCPSGVLCYDAELM